jgi:hypothetical protein
MSVMSKPEPVLVAMLRQACNVLIFLGYVLGGALIGCIVGPTFALVQPTADQAALWGIGMWGFCLLVGVAAGAHRCWLTPRRT